MGTFDINQSETNLQAIANKETAGLPRNKLLQATLIRTDKNGWNLSYRRQ